MFVWECLKSEGKHLGMCVDGFMFGSCCGHNDTANDIHHEATTTVNLMTLVSSATKPAMTSSSSTTPTPTPTTSEAPIEEIEIPATKNPSPPSTTLDYLDSLSHLEESLPFVTSNSSFLQPLPERPSFITTTTDEPKTMRTTTTPRPEIITTSSSTTTAAPPTTTTTPEPIKPSTQSQPPTVHSTVADAEADTGAEEDFCGKAPLFPQMRIVGGKQCKNTPCLN